MGNRYLIDVVCPICKFESKEIYAPTCGITEWDCPKCNAKIDLGEYSGISYEDCSNKELMNEIISSFKR